MAPYTKKEFLLVKYLVTFILDTPLEGVSGVPGNPSISKEAELNSLDLSRSPLILENYIVLFKLQNSGTC